MTSSASRFAPPWLPHGCDACRGTGYSGRTVLAEMLLPETDEMARAVLERKDVRQLERVAVAAGMIDRWHRACTAVEAGLTSPPEIRRVLGVASRNARACRRHAGYAGVVRTAT